ncbi:MAG: CBS domain-containing protein, partial [Acidimicrobiia bacterium]|nr:CBS domain-containing protein [Acidimicrobiia bacterium]
MNIADALQATPVSSLDLTRHVTVATDASVATTVGAMTDAKRSCACVVDGDRLVGIFTQRDFLMRVVGRRSTWDRPIEDGMTGAVRTMKNDQTAADGLAIMNDWWVRSVPVVDDGDYLVGNLSFYTIIATIGNLLK